MKLLTLAAAVDRFGWDYRFETRFAASAPVDSGVLRGDLFIIGGGDPASASEATSGHPQGARTADTGARHP
jgi:D-alanyl-D-alanine carboxypeptidase/D-alanyl-D-alanine-endopeptidase (penicillin-binding protein 4)